MGGIAPANQLRLSFTGSEDGEAETETCRAAKSLWRTTNRTSGPPELNFRNRRMRTRLHGGVGGCVKKTRKRHAVREMKGTLRSHPVGGGFKQPRAASAKNCGGERRS